MMMDSAIKKMFILLFVLTFLTLSCKKEEPINCYTCSTVTIHKFFDIEKNGVATITWPGCNTRVDTCTTDRGIIKLMDNDFIDINEFYPLYVDPWGKTYENLDVEIKEVTSCIQY